MIAKIIAITNKEAKGIDENGKEVKLKAQVKQKETGVYVGDNVILGENILGVWTIKEVLPRKNLLIRPVIANLDVAFITVSIFPEIDYLVLDKILINCEMNNITPILIVNKADLINDKFKNDIYSQYGDCVKKIIVTNALTGENMEELKSEMVGKTSAFIGQSAVGKSTILNNFDLGKTLKTSDLTLKAGKKKERGRNTTRASTLFPLDFGGYVADSPGFSKLDFSLIRPQELVFYFPDLEKYRDCKFSNCTHIVEGENCGLQRAFKEGKINAKRFERFLKLQKMLNERWKNRYD